mmetsp:Transcript_3697/g.9228  ORF Transcript_3697/g.9228 Transcript_3697/m.9228 type:complete len:204 (-) Transcript_3697:301-912(-)
MVHLLVWPVRLQGPLHLLVGPHYTAQLHSDHVGLLLRGCWPGSSCCWCCRWCCCRAGGVGDRHGRVVGASWLLLVTELPCIQPRPVTDHLLLLGVPALLLARPLCIAIAAAAVALLAAPELHPAQRLDQSRVTRAGRWRLLLALSHNVPYAGVQAYAYPNGHNGGEQGGNRPTEDRAAGLGVVAAAGPPVPCSALALAGTVDV